MPLFLRKSRYHKEDEVLAIVLNTGHWEVATINLFVGVYDPITSIRHNRIVPAMQPWWQLERKITGSMRLLDPYDYGQIPFSTSSDYGGLILLGTVVGRLDMADSYSVNSYLRRCLHQLRPYYEPLLFDRALERL